MLICPAQPFDISAVMAVEHNAFIPEIQEKQKTFEQRLAVFPQGFTVLQDTSDEVILRNKRALTVGYFCSELWDERSLQSAQNAGEPGESEDSSPLFALGHSPKKSHCPDGTVLYISSFAIMTSCRGKGIGEYFFSESIRSICGALPHIKTVLLLVSSDWKKAQHIYEKCGFKTIRLLSGFFPSLSGTTNGRPEESADGITSKSTCGRADGIVMTCSAERFRGRNSTDTPDTSQKATAETAQNQNKETPL